MARGVRKSLEDKIAEKQELIQALETRLLKENDELEALLTEQKISRLECLEELLTEANLTVEEAVEILKEHTENRETEVA